MNLVGASNLISSVEKLEKEYDKKLQKAVKSAGLIVQNAAHLKVPAPSTGIGKGYAQGVLQSSIHEREVYRSGTGYRVDVGTDVEYGPYVKFGTSRMAPQSYMRPALDESREKCAAEIAKVMKGK